jgi:hypothetical protein
LVCRRTLARCRCFCGIHARRWNASLCLDAHVYLARGLHPDLDLHR